MDTPRILAGALFLCGVIAGCATPAATAPPPAHAAALAFSPPVVGVAKCFYRTCYEPTIATDPTGRIFVADGSTSDIGVSTDGGATFAHVKAPPMPAGSTGDQADVILQVSPAGRLYWSAILVEWAVVSGPTYVGIQVAWSDDGGASWAGNVHLSPTTGAHAVIYPDRQWLGFGEGQVMYATYSQIPTGVWIARSDDAGATWGGWTRGAPVDGRTGGSGGAGPPIVDAAGNVFVPACARDGSTLVFRSSDGAKTFTSSMAAQDCNWFPMLAYGAGEFRLATTTPSGAVMVATSPDGTTFSPPTTWDNSGTAAPWIRVAKTGETLLAWYAGDASSSSTLRFARSSPDHAAVVANVTAKNRRTSALTDYASFDVGPDGRIAIAWVAENQVKTRVER